MANLKVPGIYLISNIHNGKKYVGSAVSISGRWQTHKTRLNKKIHTNHKLQAAWNKYGPDSFRFEVLHFVNDKRHLVGYEQVYLDFFFKSAGHELMYNINRDASSRLGMKASAETRLKCSLWQRGLKRGPPSAETRAKIGEANKLRTLSQETKIKISAALRGTKHSAAAKAKMSLSQSRRAPPTADTREKLAMSKRKRVRSIAHATGEVLEFASILDAVACGFSEKAIYRALRDGEARSGYFWQYI